MRQGLTKLLVWGLALSAGWPVFDACAQTQDNLQLDHTGRISWQSPFWPGYHGLEFSRYLDGPWTSTAFWNVAASNGQSSVRISLPLRAATNLFFRLASSPTRLPWPAGSTTTNQNSGFLHGRILFWEGDFFPGPPSGTITPVSRPLFVFGKVDDHNAVTTSPCFYSLVLSRLVAVTESDGNGYYQVTLPAGDYSIFILEKPGKFYANLFDGSGAICPVTIQSGQSLQRDINITYLAYW